MSTRNTPRALLLSLSLTIGIVAVACGGDPSSPFVDGSTGGTAAVGATGGAQATGGAAGNNATGGAVGTGGAVTPTGGRATGGATGGQAATGGVKATGGSSTGGAAATGGASAVPACPAGFSYSPGESRLNWPGPNYIVQSIGTNNPNDLIRVKYTSTGRECMICAATSAPTQKWPDCTADLPGRFASHGGSATDPGQCVQSEAECPVTKCFNSGNSSDRTEYPCN